MDQKLLAILACPICKGKLKWDQPKDELICTYDHLAYPIRDGIPILLESDARVIPTNEERD